MTTNIYRSSRRRTSVLFMSAAVAVFVFGQFSTADEHGRGSLTQVETFSFPDKGRSVFLGNLAGQITLAPSRSGEIEIVATIVAGGDKPKDTLGLISFEDDISSGKLEFRTVYPTEKYDTYYYARQKNGSSKSTFRYQGEKVTVGSGRRVRNGLELHVDYDIKLPPGIKFSLTNGVGNISAESIDGDIRLKNKSGVITSTGTAGELSLDTGSGAMTSSNHNGDFDADSGSGRVKVNDVTGGVSVDTGSGRIEVENVGGRLSADTGSGRVDARNIGGPVHVDTGSGRVELQDVGGSVSVDTGSGAIDINGWTGGSELDLDTGSGKISASGDFAMLDNMRVDTGSGSVALTSTTIPNMKLKVSSRSIDVDFPNMSDVKSTRRSFRGTIGAGTGRGEIDTGSGSVSFRLNEF